MLKKCYSQIAIIARLIYVYLWREYKINSRYKLNFYSRLTYSVVNNLFLLLFLPLFYQSEIHTLIGTRNYVAYILLGLVYSICDIAIIAPASELEYEMRARWLEYVFTCPISFYTYLLSKGIGRVIWMSTSSLIILIIALAFLPSLSPASIALYVLVFLATLTITAQIGIIFGLIALLKRRVRGLHVLFSLGMRFLTGMIVPLQLLPPALRVLSLLFPLTFSIDLSRHFLLNTSTLLPIHIEASIFTFYMVIYVLITLHLMKTIIWKARIEGITYM